MGIYEELVARGLIAQVTNEEEIREMVNNGKATFYIGFDCTADSLLTAGQTIKHIQDTTGRYVGCLEELGLYEGWLTPEQVHAAGAELSMTLYGKYLQSL